MRIRSMLHLLLAVAVAVTIYIPLMPKTASAAPAGMAFTVNNINDLPDANPGDGKCETANGNGLCTLRAAIQEANALAGADTIVLQASTTYQLQRAGNDDNALNGDLDVTDDLTIMGVSAPGTIIDGNGSVTHDRVFDIHSGIVIISHVTIENGNADVGGGINNDTVLTLDNSRVSSNTAHSYGGGIYNYGTLTLQSSSVSGNADIGQTANGGGIFNGGNLTLITSLVSGNSAGGGAGGIYNQGTATLTNGIVSGNTAPYGGGIRNSWKLTVNNSIVSNNTATTTGGGIRNDSSSQAMLTSTTVNGNTSDQGGGISNTGMLTVINSTLNGNSASGGGWNDGGGLYNDYGTATLINSTITANLADRNGGAIYNYGPSPVTLNNVTIYANDADHDMNNIGNGGGTYNASAGTTNVINIKNSIVAGNWRGAIGGPVQDCYGTLNSGDYNLFQNVVSCNFSGIVNHNKIAASPVLGQLMNNGGLTPTNALNPGSPAIDAGDPNGCKDQNNNNLTTDQRGYSRPSGAACDMGAFESNAVLVKQNQMISFAPLPDRTISDPPFMISASASSGLLVAFTASGPCSLNGTIVTLSGQAGSCAITAHQAGNAVYNAAPDVIRGFTINKLSQTIEFASLPDKTLGEPPFTVSATASSGLPVSFTPDTPAVCEVIGNTVTLMASGICSLVASQEGDNLFDLAIDQFRSFAVFDPAKQAQTISFDALPNRQLGEASFPISASASSGLPVGFSTATFPVCQVGAGKVTVMAVGICTIIAQQDGNGTFNPALVVRSFIVFSPFKQVQTITFDPLPDKTLGDPSFTVSATASSGLLVSFNSDTPNICTASGNTITLVSAGTCTITASQTGDITYNPAPLLSRSFVVNNPAKQNQTITFNALPNRLTSDPPFTINATASSGLPVGFTASGQCNINGNTVTLSGQVGSCTITALQPGDATHNAAPNVSRSFAVTSPAALTHKTYLPLVQQ